MDAHDLFRQLTRGARFTKKRVAPTKESMPEVKVEKIIPNGHREETEASDTEDEPHSFQFLKDSTYGTPAKKKKRKGTLSEEQLAQQLKEDKIAKIRKTHRITVWGKNIPEPITTFEELQELYNLPARLHKNLSLCNYAAPTAIQMQAIPTMLKGRPLMACAPTGSGKTIAFLTPIINDLRSPKKDGFRAIVLAPTRELSQQIYRECIRLAEKTGLKVYILSDVEKAKKSFDNKNFDILISTPNRVKFLLQQEDAVLDLTSIEWFVIDEADRLMDEGKDNFKEQIDVILKACTNAHKKLALFSATYTVPVAKWALKNLKNLVRITVGQQNAATELVDQELLFVGSESGKLLAIRDLVRTGIKPPVLVFVQSKERAKQLFEELLYDGINVDVIHGDRTQQQRDNCVKAFREGHIWVLICTELMGRGIDFKGVNLVINYDFPPSTIAYIHRIGRTGRAGRPGKAITFFTHEDTPNLRSIAQIITNSGGKVPEFMLKMKKARKSEKKKLANFAPKRENISTHMQAASEQQQKLDKLEKVHTKRKKQPGVEQKADETSARKLKKLQKLTKINGPKVPLKQIVKRKKNKVKTKPYIKCIPLN